MLRFKDLVLARAEELCDHLTRENGKTRNESLFMEVLPVADAAASTSKIGRAHV